MRSIIPFLFLLAPALLAADGAASAPRKKSSAASLLPDGSQLQDVMLPRYDGNRNLTGVLKAAVITLINDEFMSGDKVLIEFSNPDGSPRGRINLATAVFNQDKGILQSADPVTLHTEKITARETGLYYAHQRGQGFLTGPATTVIKAPDKTTTMNSSPSPLRTIALVGISLATQSIAATPPTMTPEAKVALKADAVTRSAVHSDAARVAKMDLRADLDASTAATAKAREFLDQADLLSAAPSGNEPEPAPAKPLDVKPGPKDTLITCDGGIYFDADEGVLVYLKNVRVNDPQYALSGAGELKIFLTKKPEDAKPKTEPKTEPKPQTAQMPGPGMGLSGKFGDVDRMVATGAVRFLQKQPEAGKAPVEASGRIFTYRPETGNILLSGGFPWVRQGTTYMRAREPDLTLRIEKSGSFVTEGNWDMGGSFEQKPKAPAAPTNPSPLMHDPGSTVFHTDTAVLFAQGLRKTYGGRAVVDGVSITVQPREIVGLLGPNGAGKTTSFYMIAGLVPADSGSVCFHGHDISRMPMHRRARLGLGYLPQEESVFRKLSVLDNLLAILETRPNLNRADRHERAHDLLERFGITRLAKSLAITLSGGEKRRLAIARSLCSDPKLLMLDEPFAGINPIAVEDIQRIVRELRDRDGLAILITDHSVRETLTITDRAFLIHDGRVILEGASDELVNDPIARKHYLGDDFRM